MDLLEEPTTNCDEPDKKIDYQIISKPSNCIKTYQKSIIIEGSTFQIFLVTMSRTFLLAINNAATSFNLDPLEQSEKMTHDDLIQCFMNCNTNLRGLSLAVGDHSTCLIESEHSLASCTMATRLSKKLNNNRPVYVANNLQAPQDLVDLSDFMSKFYLRIFQFIGSHYNVEAPTT